MSHRVFEKIHVSRDVTWLRSSFSGLLGRAYRREMDGMAGAGRTLAENAGYCWGIAGANDVHGRELIWTGTDRLLGLNGRNRLSC
jgi:hypothetical protein